jgi:hypothetical protein
MSVSTFAAVIPYNSSDFIGFKFEFQITMFESAPPVNIKSPIGEKVAVVVGPS